MLYVSIYDERGKLRRTLRAVDREDARGIVRRLEREDRREGRTSTVEVRASSGAIFYRGGTKDADA